MTRARTRRVTITGRVNPNASQALRFPVKRFVRQA